MSTPSGLDYAAVQCPIRLWHGDVDVTVQVHHAEYVARLLPKADLGTPLVDPDHTAFILSGTKRCRVQTCVSATVGP